MIDIAIIGGGPAGLSAGLYAARAGMKTVLLEQFVPGGQAAQILTLENYPGFPAGIDGPALTMAIAEQAQHAGMEIEYRTVNSIRRADGGHFRLISDDGELTARAVIIASGAIPRKLGVAREKELTGRGVSYCATCDGAFFKGKRVAVVGGGDTALTDALVLANYAEKVYLIHRRDAWRGSPRLAERVQAQPKIEPLLKRTVQQLLGDDKLSGLLLRDSASGLETTIEVEGLFVAVGISPVSEFVAGLLEQNASGQIITDRKLQSSVPGIFAAGDVRDTLLRQVITAAADGALAATMAAEYLLDNQ
ncbi:MAG: thioredoxin-disulfide reductase [Bacillota bacterium]|nr:thioredoxin-disulfide reductase [Bacillota bacterium]